MTDDDICGAETADGTPCQHPAGSCPVPSHSDPGAADPQGRPSKFTDERRAAALDAARDGLSIAGCARAAGVDESTLRGWLERHPEFSRTFARARAEGERDLVAAPLREDSDIDGHHARFLLSTSFGYTERKEVEHDGDLGLGDLVIDFSDGGDDTDE